ncbi:MAG: RIP metalloprotease RseP [Trichodesmium sp. St16_bin4-tuft]|nr:RIP metalloprotease RseP [Trichodesmium sp. St4_bin8_1]MDE5070794.1 RIP metalloprotease RseP [Trichodesmium sp. St5_bin8]MDE5092291.1 RIP metalloprotease RseP [Trichodesmium sp. St18_bin3_1_1]MDE5101247.1 RIP metalloprotease RseP [Trichodesmium sp. St16_bin4-tuft]MDE5101950.1 RIP metalloprotease RseP [Trichodesmium sp. St19_bin2]
MSVLLAIAVLGILIVVHELGHFMAARLQNIHVNRFSIGFGPVIWKYQGPQTEYALRGFPLGGFVGFPDDDPDSKIPKDDPDLLRNRPILDRAIVLSAGVIANLIFAYFLLVTQVGIIGVADFNYAPGVKVPEVATSVSSAAARAGIKANDIILSVDNQQLGANKQAISTLVATIQNNPNKTLKMEIQRQEEKIFLEVTPELGDDSKGRIGVQLISNGEIVRYPTKNVFKALSIGAEEFQKIVILTVRGFWQLISNFSQTAGKLAGPVAIVDMGAKIAQDNVGELFKFGALISINLAVINILPLPALDGGQLAFLVIEGVRGKPLPLRIQENVMQTGLVLLLGLGVFLIIRDTANLDGVRSIFQR